MCGMDAQRVLIVALSFLVLGCSGQPGASDTGEKSAQVDSQIHPTSLSIAADEEPRALVPPASSGEIATAVERPFSRSLSADTTLQSAIQVAKTRMEIAANNLANADTTGFKRSRAICTDAGYRQHAAPGAQDGLGNPSTAGISIGQGVKVSAVQCDMSQGPLESTGRQLDLAIEGAGFFQVQDPSGQIHYTRCGVFSINSNNLVCLCSAGVSRLLEPNISIPIDTLEVNVTEEGLVSVTQHGNPSRSLVGHIQIGHFINPEGLQPLGDGQFAQSNASGPPMIGNPGQNGAGKLRQGMRERSNVDLEAEAAELKSAARTLATLQSMISEQ